MLKTLDLPNLPFNIMGDLHDGLKILQDTIERQDISDSIILCVGDALVGIGSLLDFFNSIDSLSKVLHSRNIIFLIGRGNHDNPAIFPPLEGDTVKEIAANVLLLRDFTIIQSGNVRLLWIGGGISVDGHKKVKNVDYFEGEGIIEVPIAELQLDLNPVDYVASHISPFGAWPNSNRLEVSHMLGYNIPNKLWLENISNRDYLFDILEASDPKPLKWFHGHYHKYNMCSLFSTRIISLGIRQIVSI